MRPDREPPAPRPMREDDLLRFVWIADPRMAPDGTRVAFTKVWVDAEADAYRTQVWIADVRGGDPRPLTTGVHDGSPRWSPDGRRLAFVRAREAGGPGQLFVLPMEGGEAQAVTALGRGVSAPAWSPDGTRLAFLSASDPEAPEAPAPKPANAPGRIVTRPWFRTNDDGFIDPERRPHVWVVPAAGGAPRPLTRGPWAAGAPQWARDGARVLFTADRRAEPWFGREEDADLCAVRADLDAPAEAAAVETVVSFAGPVRAFVERADGDFAVVGMVLGDRHPSYAQADVMIAEAAAPLAVPRSLTRGGPHAFGEGLTSDQHAPRGGGEAPLAFGESGRAVLAQASRRGGSMLVRVDAASGATRELTPPERDLVHGTCTPDGRHWALTIASPLAPPELFVLDAHTGRLERRWAPNAGLLAGVALGTTESFEYDAADGTRLQAWLVRPAGAAADARLPLVLQIHGGPHAAYGWTFHHEFHVLAGAGHAVLYTNPRGSTSYGERFADCIQYAYPGEDAGDLLAGVDAAVARGGVDPERLGVTGGSGGGLLTNWLIAHDDRFRAAITQRCVSDWSVLWYSSDFTLFEPTWFRSVPFRDPREFAERSPLTHVERIRTPLLIVHAEEDWRTTIAQGEALFRALKYLRRPVAMVRFPGESHELTRSGAPSRRVQNQVHARRWFGHWLLGEPAPEFGV